MRYEIYERKRGKLVSVINGEPDCYSIRNGKDDKYHRFKIDGNDIYFTYSRYQVFEVRK